MNISIPDQQLSTHFTLYELCQTSYDPDNTPTSDQIVNLTSLAAVGDQIYDGIGAFGIVSGFRSPAVNAAIPGSADGSNHLDGTAFDIVPQGLSLNVFFGQLIASPIAAMLGEIYIKPSQQTIHVSLSTLLKTDYPGILDTSIKNYRGLTDDEIANYIAQGNGSAPDTSAADIAASKAIASGNDEDSGDESDDLSSEESTGVEEYDEPQTDDAEGGMSPIVIVAALAILGGIAYYLYMQSEKHA